MQPLTKPIAVPLGKKLKTDVEKVATSLDGAMGVYTENLRTGQSLAKNADSIFPQGSSIKIPILITLLREDQDGRVEVRRNGMVGGSGVLQDFGDGSSLLSLSDLARLMCVLSDIRG